MVNTGDLYKVTGDVYTAEGDPGLKLSGGVYEVTNVTVDLNSVPTGCIGVTLKKHVGKDAALEYIVERDAFLDAAEHVED